MLTQALSITLRILIFRAGPEDFPFDSGRRLLAGCIGFALIANATTFMLIATRTEAIFSALVNVGILGALTWLTLGSQKLQNRFQQTFNALLTTSSVLTLAMIPMLIKVVPVWLAAMDRLSKTPDLMAHPEQLPELQAIGGSSLLLLVVLVWQLLVTAFIFFRAAGRKALFVLTALFVVMMIARALIGGGTPG